MKLLPIYMVDAFASKHFTGNPAAVILTQTPLNETLMGQIAMENNLSETAFLSPIKKHHYTIRWFTPSCKEVDLCGHATLASAFILREIVKSDMDTIVFESCSGPLKVTYKEGYYWLDFPNQTPHLMDITPLKPLFNTPLKEGAMAIDMILESDDEAYLKAYEPNQSVLMGIEGRGVIFTTPSQTHDFAMRFFAPKFGILEDPVTGSAYTQLAPYWAKKLQKNVLKALQYSKRGAAEVLCEVKEDRVHIGGQALLYLQGTIHLPADTLQSLP